MLLSPHRGRLIPAQPQRRVTQLRSLAAASVLTSSEMALEKQTIRRKQATGRTEERYRCYCLQTMLLL